MLFGNDEGNAFSKKLMAQKPRRKWGRGVVPVLDDQDYLMELEKQKLEKAKQREEEKRRDKEEIFQHYRNYSLATSERTKPEEMWTEEEESALYKDPEPSGGVNNLREDLFGGKIDKADLFSGQESYSFNRHRPRRMELLNNSKQQGDDDFPLSQNKLSSQPKNKREEMYEKKKLMRLRKKSGEGELFDDLETNSMSSGISKQNTTEHNHRSKSTPKMISQRDVIYEQKKQLRNKKQDITNDPESDYEHEADKYTSQEQKNQILQQKEHHRPLIRKPKQEITQDPESDSEHESQKYNIYGAQFDSRRVARGGGFNSAPASNAITPQYQLEPLNLHNNKPSSQPKSNDNGRDYNFALKGGNIFDKMGSNDPPVPRRRGLGRLVTDNYPTSPNARDQLTSRSDPPQPSFNRNNFVSDSPRHSPNIYHNNPHNYVDSNSHLERLSSDPSSSRYSHSGGSNITEGAFVIGHTSSNQPSSNSSPNRYTRKAVFKADLYGTEDVNKKQQKQEEYRRQLELQMQSNQHSNKNKKKELDVEEGLLFPSQKNNDPERSPSSKFSNDHFQQLESNISLNSAVSSPVKRGLANKMSEPVSGQDAVLLKQQKQREYQAELERQKQEKLEAEARKKKEEEEWEKKQEEKAKTLMQRELQEIEKERQEKQKQKEKGTSAAKDPVKIVNDAKAANVASNNNVDLKEDLFGNSSSGTNKNSEKRRRRANSEIVIDAPSDNTHSSHHHPQSLTPQQDSNVNTYANSPNLPVTTQQQTPQLPPLNLSPNIPQQPFTLDNNLLQHIQQEMVGQGILSYLLGQLAVMKHNNMEMQQQVLNVNNLSHLQPLNISNTSVLPISPNLNVHNHLSAPNNISHNNSFEVQQQKNELFGGRSSPTLAQDDHHSREVIQKSSVVDTSIDGGSGGTEQPEKKPKRRRKKKPSLEEELGDNNSPKAIARNVKPASVEDEQEACAPPSKPTKSRRVFKLNQGESINQQDENTNSSSTTLSENGELQVAARPKRSSSNPKKSQQGSDSETNEALVPKPSRSRRVFNINTKHESSPVLAGKSQSDDEYHNLDSDG
ncbi:hypothetical protein C9374_012477 [Naegleria lovaniensis]|uniref:Uncharacterized protein n=1 Tax=Naegleria lovaniensis TaxID=51637 RepID=A0AA88GWH8_NAELO|nr:uncharacterized protein C9374_012477 [Naegleria lovaniensis]KAG2392225.1 hypothetical protein C9374_012477 [Naegleria lovaniensis]